MDRTDSRLAHSPEPASDDAASPFNPPVVETRLDFDPVPLRLRHDGLTAQKQRDYVEALADCGVAREAAARIGISEQAINRVRRRADAVAFDRACEAASMFGARRLRSIAFERAVEGTLKAHYYRGERVGEERVFDNRLLTYLLGKTEHLIEPSEESRAVCRHWQAYMDALEQGLPAPATGPTGPKSTDFRIEDDEDPQVWCEDGIWWTFFPPPRGFDGDEEGTIADADYRRTLTDDERAAMKARNRAADEAELDRCCAIRDDYFGLPPRGSAESFFPRESRNNETSEEAEDRDEPPIEYKSLIPPRTHHRGEGRDLTVPPVIPAKAGTRERLPVTPAKAGIHEHCRSRLQTALFMDPGLRRDDEVPTSKPPHPGILTDEPPGAST